MARSGATPGACLRASDAEGLARADAWSPGTHGAASAADTSAASTHAHGERARCASLQRGDRAAIGWTTADDRRAVLGARRRSRRDLRTPPTRCVREASGDVVRYVVNRNINYTNVCTLRLPRSARSPRASAREHLRGRAYDLALDEIARRVVEAWERGATEVCMQGGIHPRLHRRQPISRSCARRRSAVPDMHVHAFSPLEVAHGAANARHLRRALPRPPAATRGSAPCRERRRKSSTTRCARVICPDKLDTHNGSASSRPRIAGPADDRDDHVRPRRDARVTGRGTCCTSATCRQRDRRLHRVRAAAVRPHGSADVSAAAARARDRRGARRC